MKFLKKTNSLDDLKNELDKTNDADAKRLWASVLLAESNEGRNLDECISTANLSVDAFNKKFNIKESVGNVKVKIKSN